MQTRARLFGISVVVLFAGAVLAGCFHAGTTDGVADSCTKGTATGTLKLGTLLPLSGSLQAYGPDMERAVKLAAKQINAAGGVNGKNVELFHEDSKTDKTQAPNAFNSLVNKGVVGVVGAASSGVTGSVLDLAIQNKVVVVTPASTSPALTNASRGDNSGYFYRVPPSDALQGKVLAKLVKDDGKNTVRILAVNNPYGQGLGAQFKTTFTALGGTVQGDIIYFEEGGTVFATQVASAAPATGGPAAVVLIAYPTEGAAIMKEAFATGATQRAVWFFSEGVNDQAFVDGAGDDPTGKSIVEGFKGTTPQATNNTKTQKFVADYKAEYPTDTNGPGLFAAESYDATWALALAAQCGGDNTSNAIKAKMRTIMNTPGAAISGENPTDATTKAGSEDVNWVGASGDFNWDANGDPAGGIYSYWRVTDGVIVVYQRDIQPS